MAIPTCPHCYRRVIPQSDGTCPACGKNTQDLTHADPDKVMVSIHGGSKLPALCHHCGTPTDRLKKLALASEARDTAMGPLVGRVVSRLIPFLGLFLRLESESKTVELHFNLPTCAACSKLVREIVPKYIDFEDQRIDLIVHTQFKKALEQE